MDSNLKTAHGRNYIRLLGFLAVLSVFLALPLAGCAGSYSKQRADEYDQFHRNTVETAERAMQDKLTPVELRSNLESIDKARLAELALKGNEADLEGARAKFETESDDAVAKLFGGDSGRE